MIRRSIAVATMALLVVAALPALAQAANVTEEILRPQNDPQTQADGWLSANCTKEPTEEEPPVPGEFCGPEHKTYDKRAGGHPNFGFTEFKIKEVEFEPGKFAPEQSLKDLRVELPEGLSINAESPLRCPLSLFTLPVPSCPKASAVGTENLEVALLATGTKLPPTPPLTKVTNFDLEPKFGEPALFGFVLFPNIGGVPVFLETEVAWESDYHSSFVIRDIGNDTVTGIGTLVSRLVNRGRAGADGNFITNPTTCLSPDHYSALFGADSYQHEDPAVGDPTLPNSGRVATIGESPEECELVPFTPELETDPGTAQVDSPSPATVVTKVPYVTGGESISQSHLKDATVVMPKGMGLNPAGSDSLQACTNAQFHKGERVDANSCPPASKIGTAEVDAPAFPKGSLTGNVYIGQQLSRDPTSGNEFRIFIEAGSDRYGIHARLIGNTKADPKTGQLTTEVLENPQVPFKSVTLRFDGTVSVLTSPPTCAAAKVTSTMVPWANPSTSASPSDEFALSGVPGGGSCPQALAQRKYQPSYTAKPGSAQAGVYSPFKVHIGRNDGEQEVKGVDVTLPKGMTGNLSGIPYCSDAALSAAASRAGREEQSNPSCPASLIGVATTRSGTGANPVKLDGNAYLAGPYKGAPLSLAVITPAVSGPFDLGTVVVRVALNVNPETAQIHAVTDVIPDVFGGVKLDLRSIDVNLDRTRFMLNPTNCAAQATTGSLAGGGADPTNPAAFSSYPVNSPFQATGCNKLGFKPKLKTTLFGPIKRAKNPRIKAVMEAREGDANIVRAALTLPHSLFLDQSHIKTVCTRPQLASQTCPSAAVYGHAEASSPLLDNPLKGAVYLVSSNHKLPDLVADLRGQVNIQLHGVISSKHGGIKTVFNSLPDVPVKKFVLNMSGGKKSLLVNSTNLCKSKQASVMKLEAQNGKKLNNNKLPLKVTACGKKKK